MPRDVLRGGCLPEEGPARGEGLDEGGPEPHAGLFGKLPLLGDFVWRGLAPAFRARWDAFATRHLLVHPPPWPEGGLGLRLLSGGRAAVALVLPSCDAVGRAFPLAGLLVLPAPPPLAEARAWTEAAHPPLAAAARGGLDPDALWAALDAVPRPGSGKGTEGDPLVLWAGGTAVAADPDNPGGALLRLLSLCGPSNPS